MKRILVLLLSVMVLFCGCTAENTVGETPDSSEVIIEETAEEMIDCHITGSFAATVRHLIPDYCGDQTTITTAVITLFQDVPIAIYVGEEIASRLCEGEAYVFTVNDNQERSITQEEFELKSIEGGVDVRDAMIMKNVSVESVRLAEEGETGLSSNHLRYESIKK